MGSQTSSAPGPGVLTHGGKYVRYNLHDNLFEVPAKYVPPVRFLGRGANGVVCAATDEDINEVVAIKKIWNAFNDLTEAKRTLREIKILRHLDHENVITIKDVIRPPKRSDFNDVYIVSEVMDTDLHDLLQSGLKLTEEQCQYIIYQVLRGLKYVHSANVLHRDLKPSNLFLDLDCNLKIGDFGLARSISTGSISTTKYEVVTRWYRAPEVLISSDYNFAIDVWSVGCILAEIITKKPFFQGDDIPHQLKLIVELLGTPDEASIKYVRNDDALQCLKKLPRSPKQKLSARLPKMHPLALDLLGKMLVFDPKQRITVDEALCHPYLSTLHDISDEPICTRPMSFDFEQQLITVENVKELIWKESLVFNPDPVR